MNFTKETWTKDDIQEFLTYLKSIENTQKIDWAKRLLNSNLKTYALKASQTQELSKQISKGNFEDFLKLCPMQSVEETYIFGNLLTLFEDFEKFEFYLRKLAKKADNWATCDSIPFKNIKKKNKEKLYDLAKEFAFSSHAFTRRIGLKILFEFKRDKEKLGEIFEILNSYKQEEHYYVNMIIAWLVCELFIINKKETLQFLQNHNLNKFCINKAISKCRDSFRVSKQDKQMLLQFKTK